MAALERTLFDVSHDGDVHARLESMIRSEPLTILRIATAIGENRGQWPADSTTEICRQQIGLLGDCDKRAVVAEMEACLIQRDVDQALEWMFVIGAVSMFLPEVAATEHLAQEGGRRHKDVWEHTKLVVKQAVRRPAVRWAALLHDIGKVPTRTFTKKGVHFHGHAEVGARMFDKIARRLPFERAMRRKIRFLIKYHLRSAQYEPSWTDSAVRRFHHEMQEHLTDLLDLSRADITSKRPGRRRFLLHQISRLQERIDTIVAEDARVPPLRTGIGRSIMTRFALPPSKLIGDLKKALEREIEESRLEPHREDEYYLDWLAGSGLLPETATRERPLDATAADSAPSERPLDATAADSAPSVESGDSSKAPSR